jgi:hypothetical protein
VTPGVNTLDSILICSENNDQQAPSVTFGDSVFLVSWLDKRASLPAIYSARVNMDGSVIEHNGFLLHADSMNQISPVSAFDGNNFLVLWVGFDAGGFGLYAKRVSPEGVVIDSMPLEICYDPFAKYNPAIAFDGSNYMVIWDDARLGGSEFDEWCARISADGELLDTNAIPVDTSPAYQYSPSIAYVPPYFLAVWTDDESGDADLVGKRIDTNGNVIDSVALPISSIPGVQGEASVFPGTERYFVAWEDGRNGYENKDIYGEFVDTAGAALQDADVPPETRKSPLLVTLPNPFSGQVQIRVHPECGGAYRQIRIYDVCGRIVRTHTFSSGSEETRVFVWDTRDNAGNVVSAGIYFCVAGEGGKQLRQQLLFLK